MQVCKDPEGGQLFLLDHRNLTTEAIADGTTDSMREQWEVWWRCQPDCIRSHEFHNRSSQGGPPPVSHPHSSSFSCCVRDCVMGCKGHMFGFPECTLSKKGERGFRLAVVTMRDWADVRQERNRLMRRELEKVVQGYSFWGKTTDEVIAALKKEGAAQAAEGESGATKGWSQGAGPRGTLS